MKKYLFILIIAIMLCLTACGSKKESKANIDKIEGAVASESTTSAGAATSEEVFTSTTTNTSTSSEFTQTIDIATFDGKSDFIIDPNTLYPDSKCINVTTFQDYGTQCVFYYENGYRIVCGANSYEIQRPITCDLQGVEVWERGPADWWSNDDKAAGVLSRRVMSDIEIQEKWLDIQLRSVSGSTVNAQGDTLLIGINDYAPDPENPWPDNGDILIPTDVLHNAQQMLTDNADMIVRIVHTAVASPDRDYVSDVESFTNWVNSEQVESHIDVGHDNSRLFLDINDHPNMTLTLLMSRDGKHLYAITSSDTVLH